ncbi:MAG TPA: orotidine-5'-phosphate decarboxylase [Stellaceae bacterium]|nr:orotidine-5'-phosphate decarboxylase [Stellaceae bacterium]
MMAITEIDERAKPMAERPSKKAIPVTERLIVALDVESDAEARRIVDELGESVSFYKVGLGLQFRGGIPLAEELKKKYGKRVFLDSKIWDIEATTFSAVQSIAAMGMDFVTVHGNTSVLKEGVAGRGNTATKVFAITVLTSLDDKDLLEMGYTVPVDKMVAYKTRSAIAAGCDGVITSGLEAGMVRELADDMLSKLLIVTPGIRSAGVSHDDQKRVATPESAIRAGADYIVMGRQILRAKNRRDEAKRVLEMIDKSLP